MKKLFLSQKHCFWAALFLGGCIGLDSPTIVESWPYPTEDSTAIDVQAFEEPDRTVELFQPNYDPALLSGDSSVMTRALPVRVREQESGQVVEYQWSRRNYGSWNARREYLLNLALMRIFFLRPSGLFEDTTGLSTVDALFARAAENDRFTHYVDSAHSADYERVLLTTENPKVIGIVSHLDDAGDSVFIKLVAPASPAYRAGLRRGMVILAINDSSVAGDSAGVRFNRFLSADTAGSIKLKMRRSESDGGVFSAEIVRETVDFPSVLADHIGSVGYIAISSFTGSTLDGGSTYTEFKAALKATRQYPATILDLRGNGGGSLTIALQMCEEVLASGTLFKVVERRFENGGSVRYEVDYKAHAGESGEGRQFVLLADSSSASASELFITALREGLGARFVGTHTYGKGVGQAAFHTPGNAYSVITYGRVLTAAGVDYNGTGLTPTHPSSAKPDAMLAEAALVASGALAKGSAAHFVGAMAGEAAVLDWNRREGRRSGVVDLVFPGDAATLDVNAP